MTICVYASTIPHRIGKIGLTNDISRSSRVFWRRPRPQYVFQIVRADLLLTILPAPLSYTSRRTKRMFIIYRRDQGDILTFPSSFHFNITQKEERRVYYTNLVGYLRYINVLLRFRSTTTEENLAYVYHISKHANTYDILTISTGSDPYSRRRINRMLTINRLDRALILIICPDADPYSQGRPSRTFFLK